MNENKESVDLSLRGFIKSLLSVTGGAALLSSLPWLLSCTPEKLQELGKEKARLGLIGSGSRGQYHIHNLMAIPHADLVAICDPYAPNREAALALYAPMHLLFGAADRADDAEAVCRMLTRYLEAWRRHYDAGPHRQGI